MTAVAFHTGVEDKLGHTCRLLRKASRQGAKVVVTGSSAVLQRLDQALWTFQPLEFVPHAHLRAGAKPPPRLARTAVWLLDEAADAPHHEVLVNLGPELPDGVEHFARVIEIVSIEADDRASGRQRWRHYESRGFSVTHHVQGATA